MQFKLLEPKQSLNKAYLKQKVGRYEIELFKNNFKHLLERIDLRESEEHLKNVLSDFLKDTWYKDRYEINTKGRNDLVIHDGRSGKDPVGVIFEIKKLKNLNEMVSGDGFNAKSLQQLILYYLRERIEFRNINVKYLIVTNVFEWYIFDESWFEQYVYRNGRLRKDYENWLIAGKDTRFFYDQIAKELLDHVIEPPVCTYFDMRDYEEILEKNVTKADNRLIPLFKVLSPQHLLREPFLNDSNKLDNSFYLELLHIIGLEEKKAGNKWLIRQKDHPDAGSLLENTIVKLEVSEKLYTLKNATDYGATRKEQTYNVALELVITWVNRILFLKLLESQLFRYHKQDPDFLFLNIRLIFDFGELNNLFFQVLAEKIQDRRSHLNRAFQRIPYLNSSLFERIELEKVALDISALDNRMDLPLFSNSVLKDVNGRRRSGWLRNLDYLFEFLNAYDFSSDGSEDIQEENKGLINASVLGLIFEKINGYKDGSFYTPGFVTMYMTRQTIQKALLEKFNRVKGWECGSIKELYNKIEDKTEANYIIDELFTVCDPAVGSGHFLVSALNEIIYFKSELKILRDREGKTLRDYEIDIVNDELIVLTENGAIFEYNPLNKESKRIQQALFHEKEIIIENCLFGVDINENSVKICRLRLWIELLKNTYYKDDALLELETLPNIDINIKCGNSLISRFELNDELLKGFKKTGHDVAEYKDAVRSYKRTKSRETKYEALRMIDEIKVSLTSTLDDKFLGRIAKARGNVVNLESDVNARLNWNESVDANLQARLKKARTAFERAENEKKEILGNVVYRNCFEWRFEFPEVLNENAQFEGFDVIIGNPPWGADIDKRALKLIKSDNEDIIVRMIDSFMFFINKAFTLKSRQGIISMIIPDVLLYQLDNEKLRRKILNDFQLLEVINLGDNIFPGVARACAIVLIGERPTGKTLVGNYRKKMGFTLDRLHLEEVDTEVFKKLPYNIFATSDLDNYALLTAVSGIPLGYLVNDDGIQRGVSPDLKEAFIVTEEIIDKYSLERLWIKPTVTGGVDVKRYYIQPVEKNLLYISSRDNPNEFPHILDYIGRFRDKITCSEVREGKHPYWALHRERSEDIFVKQEKIIGVITSDHIIVALDDRQLYPTDGIFILSAREGVSNRFLVAVLNSKIATFIYRLLSFEEGRAMAQIKPSILKDIPVPEIPFYEQEKIGRMTDIIAFLLKPDQEPVLGHTSNDRIAATLQEVLDMMIYEIYFSEHFRTENLQIIQYLNPSDLRLIPEHDLKVKTILDFYYWYQSPENPVRQRIILADTKSRDIVWKIKST